MTQTLNITDTRSQLSELVNQVFRRESRIIIQKSGIAAAALISAEDLARLEAFEQRTADFADLAEIQGTFADVPLDEHEREVSRAVTAARGRLHAKAGQERFTVLDRMCEALKDVPDSQIEAEVARAVTQVRAEKQNAGLSTPNS